MSAAHIDRQDLRLARRVQAHDLGNDRAQESRLAGPAVAEQVQVRLCAGVEQERSEAGFLHAQDHVATAARQDLRIRHLREDLGDRDILGQQSQLRALTVDQRLADLRDRARNTLRHGRRI